jgi:hypothetical protein
MRGIFKGVVAFTVWGLAGCTELSVTPSNLTDIKPTKGIQYGLPYASYDLTITRRLTGCTADSYEIETSIVVTKEISELDTTHIYEIDYESLSSWFKTSEFSVERHPNLMIKKLGVSSADQTGTIIVDTVTTVGKIAATIAGVPSGAKRGPTDRICKPEIERLVKEVKDLTDRTKVIEEGLRKATARHETLRDTLSLFKPDSSLFPQTLASAREVRSHQERLNAATTAATKGMEKLSDIQKMRWPKAGNVLLGPAVGPDRKTVQSWLTVVPDTDALKVTLQIADRSGYGLKIADPEAVTLPAEASGKDAKGLRYRDPVMGQLSFTACSTYSSDSTCQPNEMKTSSVKIAPMPQLARVRLLPYSNGVFQSNVLNAEFAENGALVSMSYSELTARADVLALTAGKTADAVAGGLVNFRKAGPDARIAALNKEAEEFKARSDARKAREVYSAPSTVDNANRQALIDSDTQLKKAQLANYEADLALKKALAPPAQ